MLLNTTTRFKKIVLHADGIQLQSKSNSFSLIRYDAIEKIYLTTNKSTVGATYLYFSLVGFCVLFGWYWYSFLVFLVTFFFLLLGIYFLRFKYWMNWNKYPSCQLVIVLKNGNHFTKNIAPTHKSDTIDFINRVKKAI